MKLNDTQIREVQKISLNILIIFDSFCRENNLNYFLCGGCLIGAIRNKGFIPWDDDIDIFMMRKDYEKLSLLWGEKIISGCKFCRTNLKNNYHDGGSSIRNINTTDINYHSINEDICHGIGIEIMPLDGCPSDFFSRVKQLFFAFLYNIFNVQRLPNNKGKIIRMISSVIYFLVRSKEIRYKIWKFSEKQMSKYSVDDCDYITELIGSIKGMFIMHKKDIFSSISYTIFEGIEFPVMKGYHEYLSSIWGDYMKLPPEIDRVPKHDVYYFNSAEPYTNFKGVYYLNGSKK